MCGQGGRCILGLHTDSAKYLLSETGHDAGLLWVAELDSEQEIQHGFGYLVIELAALLLLYA